MTFQIASLAQAVHDAVAPFAETGEPYALIDFPSYSNVGDSAIWLGEIAMLRQLHGRAPSYVCNTENFDAEELRAKVATGVIYMHGGGNFGDLYPRHQRLRERAFLELPGRRFVILPQSIHFDDPTQIDRTRSILQGRAVTLLVRDQASFAIASRFDCDVKLVPDAALCLGPTPRFGKPTQPLLILKRTDGETIDRTPGGVDWLEEPSSTERRAKMAAAVTLPRYPREAFYMKVARDRLDRGLRLLSRGERVATDRLHAHILCLLLGIEHYVADNRTGKISAFIAQWTAGSPLVKEVADLSAFI